MLRLFDTALGEVVPIEPRQEGRLSMYVCGPTVSGPPHLGHGRFNVVWDTLRRFLTWTGVAVDFVSNVTDIEDKILARAEEEGRPFAKVAADYEKLWWQTMDRLGVERPTQAPHATSYVSRMVEFIWELVERGNAYVGGDGVYFAAASVQGYGLLARQPLESLRSGARVEPGDEAGKRSPIDFALWKLSKPGEPSWESPWGPGRPGWHTECVVMSLDLLGDGFDLHTGGLDLAFPHHENERAQALAMGHRFASHWAHHGMIEDELGQKMSKSVGNVFSLPDLLDVYDPRAFRLQVVKSHYRSPMVMSDATLADNVAAVERLDSFGREFAGARGEPADEAALHQFREQMEDDLDTPGAVALGFELIRTARARPGTGTAQAAAVFQVFEEALGLPLRTAVAAVPPDIEARLEAREEARAAKDFARADEIRADLKGLGWIVEDGPGGPTVRPE